MNAVFNSAGVAVGRSCGYAIATNSCSGRCTMRYADPSIPSP